MSNLKISIITPSLNQAQYLEEAILSVINQGYPNYEHIVIDGASHDETIDILKKYSLISKNLRWISEPDEGQSDALNKGLRMATGDIIGWLNADDRYLSGCFFKISEYFFNNPEVDIVYGDYRFINEQGEVIRLRKEIDFDLFILKYLHILYIPSTATFFKRKIIEDGNLFKEDYHYAMDYEFFLRLAIQGYKFVHISEYLADFRWHPKSKSSIAPTKQRYEQEKALFELDPFLGSINNIKMKKTLRKIFLIFARTKRTWFKLLKGSFWAK
jgi:glycosyltransferase involved in cell wall biosynthesis